MFDIGFTELMVIGVVALVVIGPERLPKVARTVGAYLGRLQRYVNDVKADINREIELEELKKFKQQVEETANSFESAVRSEVNKTESELNQVAQEAAQIGQPEAAAQAGSAAPGEHVATETGRPASAAAPAIAEAAASTPAATPASSTAATPSTPIGGTAPSAPGPADPAAAAKRAA
jgi:sec-independent protein translocase protein TatB